MSNLEKKFFRFVLAMTIWVIFVAFDPLGFDSATRTASSNFLQTIFEPFYGFTANPAQKKIAVVEITDQTIAQLNRQDAVVAKDNHRSYQKHTFWPLPYYYMDDILDSIIQSKPRAVFVDIHFAGARGGETLNQFADFIKFAKDHHIPIFFANGQLRDGYGALPSPLRQHTAIAEWNAKSGLYALEVADCRRGASCRNPSDRVTRDTAALALYMSVCKHGFSTFCRHDISKDHFRQDMAVRWGTRLPPQQLWISGKRAITDCQNFGPSPWDRTGQALENVAHSVFQVFHFFRGQPCPYELTIDASLLNRMTRPVPEHPAVNIDSLLTGRVVFVGADIRAEHDVVNVPGVGLLAGVQAQAMAFDNLLSFGRHYFRNPKEIRFGHDISISPSTILEGFIWAALCLDAIFDDEDIKKEEFLLIKMWKSRHKIRNSFSKVTNIKDLIDINKSKNLIIVTIILFTINNFLFFYDVRLRNIDNMHCILEFYSIYLIGLLLLLFGLIANRQTEIDPSKAPPSSESTALKDFFLRPIILFTVLIPALMLNEFYLHWRNNDWIGLALLWSLLPEIIEKINPHQETKNGS